MVTSITANKKNLTEAFASVGIQKGDVVYLSTQLYGIGFLSDTTSRAQYLEGIYSALYAVIGSQGTLVVPTFTQQVGRFGLPFILEKTESLTGIFSEYIRLRSDSVRSLHPVFSVASVGHLAQDICNDISPISFGVDSAFDRLVQLDAKALCMGFDYYSGHIVSLMHHVETVFAVPYYYNKIVDSPVYVNGLKIEKPFIINVKYLDVECQFYFNRYIDALDSEGMIKTAKFGRGEIHAVNSKLIFNTGISLLKKNVYSFLMNVPKFHKGRIPFDGPPDIGLESKFNNWTGFHLES